MSYKVVERLNKNGGKDRNFKVNDIVRHFKGSLYRIIAIAMNTETEELEIVYEYVGGIPEGNGVWARPKDMFEAKVDKGKYPDSKQEYRMEIVDEEKVVENI